MKIKSKRVFINENILEASLEIKDDKIIDILPYDTKEIDIDYNDSLILPGFIDIHCHGAYGFDTNSGDYDGLKKWAKNITSEGVTGFLATTITDNKDILINALKNVANVKKNHIVGKDGADILGIHFEGPYINEEYAGAQPKNAIVKPDIEEFKEYLKYSSNLIRIITMASEKDNNYELIKFCNDNNIIASIGHSGATYEEAIDAITYGAKSITHTFNAQTPFKHRSNGIVGVALRNEDLYSEIICDGHHVSFDALNIFYKCKDKDHAIMISDALMCKGFKAGYRFTFGGQNVEIYPDGTAHLYEFPDKNLAGSTLRINEGLRNIVEKAKVPFVKAVNSCTINPARLLSLDDHIGLIKVGYDADLVVLDNNYTVLQTYCKGVVQ